MTAAYRARRDWDSPVPLITTSHLVSESDSMVVRSLLGVTRGRCQKEEGKKLRLARQNVGGDF